MSSCLSAFFAIDINLSGGAHLPLTTSDCMGHDVFPKDLMVLNFL